VIPYGKGHSVAMLWNTSVKGYTVPLPLPFIVAYSEWRVEVEERQ